jgi:hypothetical protein
MSSAMKEPAFRQPPRTHRSAASMTPGATSMTRDLCKRVADLENRLAETDRRLLNTQTVVYDLMQKNDVLRHAVAHLATLAGLGDALQFVLAGLQADREAADAAAAAGGEGQSDQ